MAEKKCSSGAFPKKNSSACDSIRSIPQRTDDRRGCPPKRSYTGPGACPPKINKKEPVKITPQKTEEEPASPEIEPPVVEAPKEKPVKPIVKTNRKICLSARDKEDLKVKLRRASEEACGKSKRQTSCHDRASQQGGTSEESPSDINKKKNNQK